MRTRLICLALTTFAYACSSTSPATDAGDVMDTALVADGIPPDTSPPDTLAPDGFRPGKWGHHLDLVLGVADVLGSKQHTLLGRIRQAAREDFDPKDDWSALEADRCKVTLKKDRVPSCVRDGQCAPEQQCRPTEFDDNGGGDPNSKQCITPLPAIDAGPILLDGFKGGQLTLEHNSSADGYLIKGSADGSFDPSKLELEKTYTFSASGQTLGAFTGSMTVGPAFTLESPAIGPIAMGSGIKIPLDDDLVLKWSGKVDGGFVRIALSTGTGEFTAKLLCKAMDDGEFTVPKESIAKAALNPLVILNRFSMSRITVGTIDETIFPVNNVSSVQAFLVFAEGVTTK